MLVGVADCLEKLIDVVFHLGLGEYFPPLE